MRSLIRWLLDGITDVISSSVSYLILMYNLVVGQLYDWINDAIDFIWGMLPISFIADFFNQTWFVGTLKSSMDLVAYFFPLVPGFILVTTVYGVCAVIRLARWVKSFIPTISGA